jgi:integrase
MQAQPNEASRTPKRVRVAPNLWQRTKDGVFEDIRVNPATKKQELRTLKAKTVTEAKREQRSLAVKIDRGEAPAPTRQTVAETAADYFAAAEAKVASGEMARRTVEPYRQRWNAHLDQRLGGLRVQAVQASHIGSVLREFREEGLSSWTLHGVLTVAAAIFNHAVARELISESPTRRLARGERPRGRNKKKIRILSPDEIGRVVAAATPRWRLLFITAAHTGARISELLALQASDIDWDANTISISKQLGRDGTLGRTKTERGVRTIGMSDELRRALREHVLASGPGFVFACESGRPPSYRNARRALASAVDGAGIEYEKTTHRVGFHVFRHGAVSALIRAGADPVRVARFVGDRVETVLSTYAQEWAMAKEENLGDVLAAALALAD